MELVLRIIGWWAGGYFLSSIFMIKIGNPCPCPKCWIGSLASIAYGIAYYYVFIPKGIFPTPEYLLTVIIAAIVGAAVTRCLCPIRMK
jgi:hypothetical protein